MAENKFANSDKYLQEQPITVQITDREHNL